MKALLSALLFILIFSPSALANSGMSFSISSLSSRLGKQVGVLDETGERQSILNGRETTEWFGIEGFTDLSPNWRVMYGAQGSLLAEPIIKLSGGLAFLVQYDYKFPFQPYVFVGVDPVFSVGDQLPNAGLGAHAGLGVEYHWNNTLYSQFEMRSYLLGPYREEVDEKTSQSQWLSGSFSLRGNVGFYY